MTRHKTKQYQQNLTAGMVNNNSSFTFKPRLLEGVRLQEEPLPESLILDGQQRLTSMFMCLRSGAAVSIGDLQTHRIQERWYYIDIPAALNPEIDYLR
jgi:hypothetical protein